MASESGAQHENREIGHRNHFQLLAEGRSWSGREPNTLFQNRGDGVFDEVGNVLGLYLRLDSRGAATGDLDGDGDLDLVVTNRNNPAVKIFRNDSPGQGNVVLLELAGGPLRPAVGAQAIVTCDGERQLRQVEAGSGFLSQGDSTLHFGVGGCSRVEEVRVRWPGLGEPSEQSWGDLAVNQIHRLTMGESRVESTPLRARNFNRARLAAGSGELSAPRPDLTFERLGLEQGGELRLAELDDATVVLNFWATWCTACLAEMPDLEELAGRYPKVKFLGVALDSREGEGAVSNEAVLDFAHDQGVSYPQLRGDLAQQTPFTLLAGSPPGVVPLTAVLHRGTIRHIEIGRADIHRLDEILAQLVGKTR